MKDKQGRPYAKLSELRVGDKVQVDGDFTCMKPWSFHKIKVDDNGKVFIKCRDGRHYLDGGYVVGVYNA